MSVPSVSTILPTLQRPASEPRSRANTRSSEGDSSVSRTPRDQPRARVEDSERDTAENPDSNVSHDFLATLAAAMGAHAMPATPVVATTPTAATTLAETAAGASDASPVVLPGSTRGPLFTVLSGAIPAATMEASAANAQIAALLAPAQPGTSASSGSAAELGLVAGATAATAPSTATAPPSGDLAPLAGAINAAQLASDAGQASGQPGTSGHGSQTGQGSQSNQPGHFAALSAAGAANNPAQQGVRDASIPTAAADGALSPTAAAALGATAQSAATSETASSASASATAKPTAAEAMTRQVFPEISRFTQTAAPGTHRLAITLHPEDLGEVKVTLIVRAGSLQVHLAADTPGARAALANGSSELHRMLEFASSSDTRIVVRDTSGASTETRTGSGSANTDAGQNAGDAHAGQHNAPGDTAPESVEEWAQGWSRTNSGAPAATRTQTPDPVPSGSTATTNPGRLDRLM